MQALQYSAGFNGQLNGRARERGYSYVRGFLAYQFLDGLKLYDRNWAVEPYGLERVELLRGPGSALYGQSSPGGLLALASKLPTETAQGEVFLRVGSHNRLEGGGDISGPLDSDGKLLARFTALGRDADTEQVYGHDDRVYVAPAVTWKIGDSTKLTALGSYQLAPDLVFINYALPALGTVTPSKFGYVPRKTFLGDPDFDRNRKEQLTFGYLFEHSFGDDLVFRQNARSTKIDTDFTYMNARALAADERTIARSIATVDENTLLRQVDNNLTWSVDTGGVNHQIMAGFDYYRLKYDQSFGTGTGPNLDLYDPVYHLDIARPAITTRRDQIQRQMGVYLQDTISIAALDVVLAGRHDWLRNETYSTNLTTGAKGSPAVTKDKAFTGQASAIYNFPGGFAPYVSYSTSFYPASGTDFSGDPFKPTEGEGIEAGVKFSPRSSVLLTASVYRIAQQNVTTSDPDHPGFNIQTGEVRSKGIELEAHAQVARGTSVTASYTYLDTEVTKSNTGTVGKTLFGAPHNQAALWIEQQLPIGLTAGGGVSYFGKSFGDAMNTFKVPSYTIFDAMLRFDVSSLAPALKGTDIQLNALNLFDKRYVSACDASNDCFYGQSRTIKATVRKRF